RGVDHRRRPLVEGLRVLVVAADAGDDEQMRVLRRDRRAESQQEQKTPANFFPLAAGPHPRRDLLLMPCGRPLGMAGGGAFPHHARPLTRRYPHSAATSATSAISSAGMSHSSRSSTTVTPRPV